MKDYGALTIRWAQKNQPWTVPYSAGIDLAAKELVPHIHATHTTLHAMKSLGKLATMFEELDHSRDVGEHGKSEPITGEQRTAIMAMSADLVTAALRFANLYDFDLATVLVSRVQQKNNVTLPNWS